MKFVGAIDLTDRSAGRSRRVRWMVAVRREHKRRRTVVYVVELLSQVFFERRLVRGDVDKHGRLPKTE